MALTARFIIDTSAAARMTHQVVASRIGPLIESGVVATTAILDAEALYAARSRIEYEEIWRDRRAAYEYLPTDDEHWQAALAAQHRLAQTGQHRAVGMPDLLMAEVAFHHNLTVVHYDSDFDTAAQVLDFAHRWVADRGSIP